MRSVNSYQDIEGEDELEEESRYESILASLLEEYDADEGDFKAYQSWCKKRARELASESMKEEK
jgi:hypothetical protein